MVLCYEGQDPSFCFVSLEEEDLCPFLNITRNLGHFEPANKVSGVSYSQEN